MYFIKNHTKSHQKWMYIRNRGLGVDRYWIYILTLLGSVTPYYTTFNVHQLVQQLRDRPSWRSWGRRCKKPAHHCWPLPHGRLEGGRGARPWGAVGQGQPGVSIIFKIRFFYKARFEGFEFFIRWPYAVFYKMQVVFYKSAHFMYLWSINSVFAKCDLQSSKILK